MILDLMDTIHHFHYEFYNYKSMIIFFHIVNLLYLALDACVSSRAWLLDEKAESRIFLVSIPSGYRHVSRIKIKPLYVCFSIEFTIT